MMPDKPYLLLDAGGTVVFPNAELLAQWAGDEGHEMAAESIMEGHFRAIHEFDRAVRDSCRFTPVPYPMFVHAMLTHAGVPAAVIPRVLERAATYDVEGNLWQYTQPWVERALERLGAAGYRMSVISNADGRVARMMDALNYTRFFERIYDSGVMGVEKPDPAIFRRVLDELGLTAAEAIYLGDVYHIDVWGANRCGLGAIHLDPYGLYGDWPGARIRTIIELADWLDDSNGAWHTRDLHPARMLAIEEG